MSRDFEWPLPPHFELNAQSPSNRDITGRCLVTLNDGGKAGGILARLDPASCMLEFTPDKGKTNLSLAFSRIKSVCLTEPVALRRIHLPETVQAESAAIKQKCRIQFKDGDSMAAETVGFVPHASGLFLFLVSGANGVLRCFIPAEALQTYQIGEQLGKILVEEKETTQYSVNLGLHKQETLRSQKLGEYLQREQGLAREQIEMALQKQREMPNVRIGQALLQEKLITQEQLDAALALQARDRKMHLGEILVNMEVVSRDTIRRVLAQKLGIPLVRLARFSFDPNAVKAVPAELVRKHKVMPLYRTDTRLVVAMENPLAADALQALAFYSKLKIDPVMAAGEEIGTAVRKFYGATHARESMQELMVELGSGADNAATPASAILEDVSESDNTLVRLVNKIIMDAYEDGASDIHIESMKGNRPTRVRFRRDGVMTHYSDIPANFRNALVSRLKIMSRLDISEKRRSQDGKLDFQQFGPARIELRVVTMPTAEGLEDVVMRILSAPRALALESLGLSPKVLENIRKMATSPHGLIFVCGPTGSGKTTTLHSMLGYINTPQRKIWTVEDPIEITQDGLRQVQVQNKIDWTFAAVLRSFLRADPDVIMVGETRDQETAKTVVEASLTGHLVLSTLHTNSAAESVIRLLDLGMDPFNFADALKGVLGQRLVRRLCACSEPYDASEEELHMLAHEYSFETKLDPAAVRARWESAYRDGGGRIALRRACGCDECNNTGYKGRLGVHELLVNSAAIRRKIHAGLNAGELLEAAMEEGMQTLRQDGIEKVLQGLTDWEQVRAL
ncbi:MAG: ATPase, T2SS/T4P/T4SS family [Noviherbaspirillum sp.]